MSRPRGGYIGHNAAPAASGINSAASGAWTLREAEALKRAGTWPSAPTVPGAPTSLAASPGNAQLSLSWTAPASNGGSAITGYSVQYTPSGGSTTTVSTGSASASYALTGLTNGTSYTVSVAAINAIGTGAYSGTATGTPTGGPLIVKNSEYTGGGVFTSSGLGSSDSPLLVKDTNHWGSFVAVRFTPVVNGVLTITGRATADEDGGVANWSLRRESTGEVILLGQSGTVVTRTASVLGGVQYNIQLGYGGYDMSMYLTP